MLLLEGTQPKTSSDVARWRKVFEVELSEADIDKILAFTGSRTGRKWMVAVAKAFGHSFAEDLMKLGEDVKRILEDAEVGFE